MGSPSVFQTAPPQPASKARITCSPQLAGGPEASQKGFGERIPAKSTERSGMHSLPGGDYSQGRAFAVRHGVYHFAPAIDNVAPRVEFRIAGPARRAIYGDHASLALNSAYTRKDSERMRLA